MIRAYVPIMKRKREPSTDDGKLPKKQRDKEFDTRLSVIEAGAKNLKTETAARLAKIEDDTVVTIKILADQVKNLQDLALTQANRIQGLEAALALASDKIKSLESGLAVANTNIAVTGLNIGKLTAVIHAAASI